MHWNGGLSGSRRWPLVVCAAAMLMTSQAHAADVPAPAERGLTLIKAKGCTACHTIDGTRSVGPTLLGLFGSTNTVTTPDGQKTVTVDAGYVRRALAEPNAERRVGYPPSTMPAVVLPANEVDDLVAAIEYLGTQDAVGTRSRREGSLGMLVIGALLFVLGHFALSSAPVRSRLVGTLGSGGFLGLYSLIAAAGLGLLIWGYMRAPYVPLWTPPLWTRWVPMVTMPVAVTFLVGAFMARNPTVVGQDRNVAGFQPRGMVTITRHPMLWAFTLWGLSHLGPNGDVATVLLAGSMIVLAVGGMLHIDARRRAAHGEDWSRIASMTSLVPFVALARGRVRLDAKGLVLPVLVGLFVCAGLLHLHKKVIGVSPLPFL